MISVTLPHYASLEQAITELYGADKKVVQTSRISGGDINDAYGLKLSDGTRFFMKSNARENVSFFTSEAVGLQAIAMTQAIGTPRILCSGVDEGRGGYAFLLMDFIAGGSRAADYWETLGRQLAAMHQTSTAELISEGNYGFLQDNYIGARKQMNTPHDKWIPFFRDCRLTPQFADAANYFTQSERKNISKLLEHLQDFLVEPEHPSLLHGDLWSGNVMAGDDGKAWLIDPAVYVGHAEADLAMTELFGGFPAAFYAAYKEVYPMQSGYEHRRDLYNLYQLLNHLNLFGGSYLPSVRWIVGKYT